MNSTRLNLTFPSLIPVIITIPVDAIICKFALRTPNYEDELSAAQASISSLNIMTV
jgi:hypothetical protein